MAASPHTRGWTPVDLRSSASLRQAASPHTRGWTRVVIDCAGVERWLPRTRGDGPLTAYEVEAAPSAASPHTRGWTRLARIQRATAHYRFGFPAHAGMDPAMHARRSPWLRGFPAHAGMDPPDVAARRSPAGGLPRTRGDGPASQMPRSAACRRRASPHTRGWTSGDQAPHSLRRGARLPRTRGDGPHPPACV